MESLYTKVVNSLRSWGGYYTFDSAMKEYADVSIYLAGGAVRDLVRLDGRKPKDLDFFIAGGGVDSFLKRLSVGGEFRPGPFGSPRWFPNEARHQYADVIPIADFYNGLWKCKDILDALNQFDFTANAIAVDLRSSHFFDPQHGLRDIQSGVIRAVRFDYPDEPFFPQHTLTRLSVLWTRLVHYAHILRFEIEPVTLRWLRKNARYGNDVELFTRAFFKPETGSFSQ